jgi:hypothetical protein
VNGFYGDTDPDSLAEYWQATRPGDPPPPWVTDSTVDESPRYIDFVLHLTPATSDIPEPAFQEDEYWFPIEVNRRTPARCPAGVQAAGPIQGDEAGN